MGFYRRLGWLLDGSNSRDDKAVGKYDFRAIELSPVEHYGVLSWRCGVHEKYVRTASSGNSYKYVARLLGISRAGKMGANGTCHSYEFYLPTSG